jgi:hypothetical protein
MRSLAWRQFFLLRVALATMACEAAGITAAHDHRMGFCRLRRRKKQRRTIRAASSWSVHVKRAWLVCNARAISRTFTRADAPRNLIRQAIPRPRGVTGVLIGCIMRCCCCAPLGLGRARVAVHRSAKPRISITRRSSPRFRSRTKTRPCAEAACCKLLLAPIGRHTLCRAFVTTAKKPRCTWFRAATCQWPVSLSRCHNTVLLCGRATAPVLYL